MIKIKAPAKINLGLKVNGITKGGYHLLDTIYASVDCYDILTIKKTTEEKIVLETNCDKLPTDSRNLIVKALIAAGIKENIYVYLDKAIPIGGGLAGGSADAAAILRVLPKLGVHKSESEIRNISISLGADVYYCYIGGVQRAKGIGEILRPIVPLDVLKVALLPQKINSSTKDVFNMYDQLGETEYLGNLDLVEEGLLKARHDLVEENIRNSLEPAIFELYPQIEGEVLSLRDKGLNVHISGSGSTLYMILKNEHDIIRLNKAYEGEVIVCSVINDN